VHFLLLKIASSVAMGILLKLADVRRLDRIPLIRANYAVAAIIAFFIAVVTQTQHISAPTAVLAAIIGALFVGGLLLWSKVIDVAGLALAVVAMRLALLVPVAVSAVAWRERPGPMQIVGVAVALLALGLVMSGQVGRTSGDGGAPKPARAWFWMLGLFLVDGLVNTGAKVFQEMMPPSESLSFQIIIFVTAFFVTTIVYYLRRERASQATLTYGAGLGAANLGNYLFLVMALAVLPGVVVYPVMAAGEVALMALAGVFIWREKVGFRSWVGIGLAVVALVLIQLGRA
jgi:drug/metabolite transporter (DMT)-like permease